LRTPEDTYHSTDPAPLVTVWRVAVLIVVLVVTYTVVLVSLGKLSGRTEPPRAAGARQHRRTLVARGLSTWSDSVVTI
jgi:hypothetical protein